MKKSQFEKEQVMIGRMKHTSSGLYKKDLIRNRQGKVVSKAKSERMRGPDNPLVRMGYLFVDKKGNLRRNRA